MSVELESAARLAALRDKANATTGETADTLAGAVDALIAGYGQGGGGEDFVGIKCSNFDTYRNIPQTADARSFDTVLGLGRTEDDVNRVLDYAFANANKNPNGGYFALLEEAYIPSKATTLSNTFQNCSKLKVIHGDLSNITQLNVAFENCTSLDINSIIARMPKLSNVGGGTFRNCTNIESIRLPASIATIHSTAFTGCTNLKTIFVPWAEGAVANAPWGATNATIVYNSTEG